MRTLILGYKLKNLIDMPVFIIVLYKNGTSLDHYQNVNHKTQNP